MPGDELRVDIEPFGPDHAQINEFSGVVLQHPALTEVLGRSEHRLIGIAPVDEATLTGAADVATVGVVVSSAHPWNH